MADSSPERFDILNLLVATDGAVDRFGYDVRRLRPNIVLSGVAADLEPRLPGQALAIGDALIGVHSVRQRCVVTTIDPDTGSQDLDVFRRIRDEFDGELALNCWVMRPGARRRRRPGRLRTGSRVTRTLGRVDSGSAVPSLDPFTMRRVESSN